VNGPGVPASYQFSKLQRDLHAMGPKQRRRLRREFTRIGQAAASDAKSRAGAWSRRIPSAISNRALVDQGRGRVGAEVRVSRRVPHARAYEGISQQGSTSYFRHPVYGNREVWVSQQTRPYLWPAVRGRRAEMTRAVEQTVDAVARECGFR
jgi:hypothetical protein